MISWNEAAEEDVPEEQEVSQSTRLQAQKVFKNEHILDFFKKIVKSDCAQNSWRKRDGCPQVIARNMISWDAAVEEDVPKEQKVGQSTRLEARKVFKK